MAQRGSKVLPEPTACMHAYVYFAYGFFGAIKKNYILASVHRQKAGAFERADRHIMGSV